MSRHGFHTFTMPEAPTWPDDIDPFFDTADRAATPPPEVEAPSFAPLRVGAPDGEQGADR